ncbi:MULTISPECIES: ribbon-helix-helix protein, CopG family [Microbacterium]|nr:MULTISPECIES: ribbon-helix-helix protein, CopG family [Microbacterium]MCD2169008.1 ribbon-helix-helix protein, CopG family [Microbacterium sp. JC 701]
MGRATPSLLTPSGSPLRGIMMQPEEDAAMVMTVRLSDEAEARLEHLAAVMQMSKNGVIEQAVLHMDERAVRRRRFRDAIAEVDKRDAELLDRLSQ